MNSKKVGKLIQVLPNSVVILEQNLPFPMLAIKKKAYIRLGYKADNLKITYTKD